MISDRYIAKGCAAPGQPVAEASFVWYFIKMYASKKSYGKVCHENI
jgi:hypothetical protein